MAFLPFSSAPTPDASSSFKGKLKLTGDLGGTASSPTVVSTTLASALPVVQGGTGQTTYTNGQLLIGNTTGNTLAKGTLTGTTNQVTVTNGSGSITLSTPQDIATTSTVQFGSLATSGVTTTQMTATNTSTPSASSGAGFVGRVNGAPSASDQRLGFALFGNATLGSAAGVVAYSSQAWSSGNIGAYMTFEVTPSSSGTRSEYMRLSSSRLTLTDGVDFYIGTTTGTKIGGTASQKLGIWGATPIVQPTTAVTASTLVGGGGTMLTDTDTFDGYTIKQVIKALRNIGLLA